MRWTFLRKEGAMKGGEKGSSIIQHERREREKHTSHQQKEKEKAMHNTSRKRRICHL
jgi:hypothetical protein